MVKKSRLFAIFLTVIAITTGCGRDGTEQMRASEKRKHPRRGQPRRRRPLHSLKNCHKFQRNILKSQSVRAHLWSWNTILMNQ